MRRRKDSRSAGWEFPMSWGRGTRVPRARPKAQEQPNSERGREGCDTKPVYYRKQSRPGRRRTARRKVSPKGKPIPKRAIPPQSSPAQSSRAATAREHRQDHPTVDLTLQRVSRSGTSHCQEPAFPPCSYARTVGVHGSILTRRRELPGRNTDCMRRSGN